MGTPRWPALAKVQQTMLPGIPEVFSGQSTVDKMLTATDTDDKFGS